MQIILLIYMYVTVGPDSLELSQAPANVNFPRIIQTNLKCQSCIHWLKGLREKSMR